MVYGGGETRELFLSLFFDWCVRFRSFLLFPAARECKKEFPLKNCEGMGFVPGYFYQNCQTSAEGK